MPEVKSHVVERVIEMLNLFTGRQIPIVFLTIFHGNQKLMVYQLSIDANERVFGKGVCRKWSAGGS